jgi:hypothetical protein
MLTAGICLEILQKVRSGVKLQKSRPKHLYAPQEIRELAKPAKVTGGITSGISSELELAFDS